MSARPATCRLAVIIALSATQAGAGESGFPILTGVADRAQTIARFAGDSPMVAIPAGTFLMGTPTGRTGLARAHDASESPQRRVSLETYHIDIYEVSLGQYLAWVMERPRDVPVEERQAARFRDLRDFAGIITGPDAPSARALASWPAFNVSWHDAHAYCAAQGRRLPTEAEWEKAARGPKGGLFPWGKTAPSPGRAVYGRSYTTAVPQVELVDSFPGGRSRYGVYHMAGNVAEWVADGPAPPGQKVVRGGSWQSQRDMLRAASRATASADARELTIGFRCARSSR